MVSRVHLLALVACCTQIYLASCGKTRWVYKYHAEMVLRNDSLAISTALKKAVQYLWDNRKNLDITTYLGLYLVKVQLKAGLFVCDFGRLQQDTRNQVIKILELTMQIMSYYSTQSELKPITNDKEAFNRDMLYLLQSDSLWYYVIYGNDYLTIYKKLNYKKDGANSKVFKNYYDLITKGTVSPTPLQTAMCLTNMSGMSFKSPIFLFRNCSSSYDCQDLFQRYIHVSNPQCVGYSLTRKLLWLLLARKTRGCMFTPTDNDVVQDYCTFMLKESMQISLGGFKLTGLLAEQIGLCSMAGFADFLIRAWIFHIQSFQTNEGCFKAAEYKPKWAAEDGFGFLNPSSSSLPGECDGYMTTVAMVVLASALRFIVELSNSYNYYLEAVIK